MGGLGALPRTGTECKHKNCYFWLSESAPLYFTPQTFYTQNANETFLGSRTI